MLVQEKNDPHAVLNRFAPNTSNNTWNIDCNIELAPNSMGHLTLAVWVVADANDLGRITTPGEIDMTNTTQLDDSAVAWQVDGIDVNASLMRPAGNGPFPAVIMVAGSGPTDRNWNTPLIPGTNGSAALLARALTAAGFITLRYDKRPSGLHARENAEKLMGKINLQSHLEELAGGVELLAGRSDVDANRIFGLGNSEGCIHVLNYQTQVTARPLAGLVLTAAPARPVGQLARAQMAAQF